MTTVFESSIDQEQILGAFALAVDVKFDSLAAGDGQTVFTYSDETGANTISFGQIGTSSDVEFIIFNNGVEYRIVAEDAIVEGEFATFRLGVDPDGTMRVAKNNDLLAEEEMGTGAVPTDVNRDILIGESLDTGDADLDGVVLNLKLANYGDTDQLDSVAQESPCAVTGEAKCLCDQLFPDAIVENGEDGVVHVSATDTEGDGEWSAPQNQELVAIHSIVLPDGKVLAYGYTSPGTFTFNLFDPETGVDKMLKSTLPTNVFCSQMSIDPLTGNVLIFGGTAGDPSLPVNSGVVDVNVFDYRTEELRPAEQGDMAFPRWYGSSINLPSGEVLLFGGRDQEGYASFEMEIYNGETGARTLTGIDLDGFSLGGYYPFMHVSSSGDVYVMGAQTVSNDQNGVYRISTDGEGSAVKVSDMPFFSAKEQGSLMIGPDTVLRVSEQQELWVIDISGDVPTFEMVGTLPNLRYDAGMVMMPDGRVAFTGGSGTYNSLSTAHYDVTIWDPSDNSIEMGANMELARLYHSSHLLLPNGSIYVAGGGAPGPLTNETFEIYAPAYLYDEDGDLATRPEILTAPSNIQAGQTFRFTVDDTSDITKITAIQSGAMTHGRNLDQRFLELEHTIIDGTTIEVTTPNENVMVPGLWMLFTVDQAGVPSEASMLGVNMVDIVDTPNLLPEEATLSVYGIDDDQINGAFEITLEARFNDLDAGQYQRVFDLGNGPASDNIILGQVASSDDMYFAIFDGDTQYRIIARDVIIEGEMAKWTAGVDDTGYMRLWKNDVLVAEGQGVVPNDLTRDSNLIGQSNWDGDANLVGTVRFLEIVNGGDVAEYVHLGLPVITLTGADSALADAGLLTYTVELDRPAFNVVTADVQITGATGPSQVVIPAGESSVIITVSYQGNAGSIGLSLTNVEQARVASELSVRTRLADSSGDNIFAPTAIIDGAEIDAGSGQDILDLSALDSPVTMSYSGGGFNDITHDGETMRVKGFETVITGDGADVRGSSGGFRNVYLGGGNDYYFSWPHPETVYGEEGNDTLIGSNQGWGVTRVLSR